MSRGEAGEGAQGGLWWALVRVFIFQRFYEPVCVLVRNRLPVISVLILMSWEELDTACWSVFAHGRFSVSVLCPLADAEWYLWCVCVHVQACT